MKEIHFRLYFMITLHTNYWTACLIVYNSFLYVECICGRFCFLYLVSKLAWHALMLRQTNFIILIQLLSYKFTTVRMAERSKALRSGRSPLLWAWVRIPLLTVLQLYFPCFSVKNHHFVRFNIVTKYLLLAKNYYTNSYIFLLVSSRGWFKLRTLIWKVLQS